MGFLAARFTTNEHAWSQMRGAFVRLFDGRIEGVDCVVWAAVLLGVTCGVLGCFIVLRKQSLLGDAIGHSVLPGVCLGFIVSGGKNTPALLAGALVAGLVATALIGLLQRTTRLKPGECMGVVFTGFYGLGIVLLVRASKQGGASAGLERFLFGQIAGISLVDVGYVAAVTLLSLGMVVVLWRKLAVWCFDEGFAHGVGIPTRALEHALTFLLTLAIVISIQAVGVVLVAALLVTPAATAYLLTDRLHRMVLLAAAFGAGAGVVGVFASLGLSSATRDMPTGATIVLAAGLLFALAFALSPRHGVLPRVVRLWERRRRTRAENLLKTLYQIMERRGTTADRRFGVTDVASARQESPAQVRALARDARRRGWLGRDAHDPIVLTDAGLDHAAHVVRNHRLWELFLTQEARLAADHVHADAEYIEHVLPRDVIARLEQMLDHPAADPHGRRIPLAGAGGAAGRGVTP
jgi:manganese/zinc/iron transport system permease protein